MNTESNAMTEPQTVPTTSTSEVRPLYWSVKRELWENPAPETLNALREVLLESETLLEAQGEKKREAVA